MTAYQRTAIGATLALLVVGILVIASAPLAALLGFGGATLIALAAAAPVQPGTYRRRSTTIASPTGGAR